MTREDVLLITELRDAAQAFRKDPTADIRLADAIAALCDRALKDDAGDVEQEPTDVDRAFDASEAPAADVEPIEHTQTRCPSCMHAFVLPGLPV